MMRAKGGAREQRGAKAIEGGAMKEQASNGEHTVSNASEGGERERQFFSDRDIFTYRRGSVKLGVPNLIDAHFI